MVTGSIKVRNYVSGADTLDRFDPGLADIEACRINRVELAGVEYAVGVVAGLYAKSLQSADRSNHGTTAGATAHRAGVLFTVTVGDKLDNILY